MLPSHGIISAATNLNLFFWNIPTSEPLNFFIFQTLNHLDWWLVMFAFGDVLSGTTFKFEYSSFVIFKLPSSCWGFIYNCSLYIWENSPRWLFSWSRDKNDIWSWDKYDVCSRQICFLGPKTNMIFREFWVGTL